MTLFAKKRISLKLHAEGLNNIPHIFGDSGRYKKVYFDSIGGRKT